MMNCNECSAQKSSNTVTFTLEKSQADEIAKTLAKYPFVVSQRDSLKKGVGLLESQLWNIKQAWNLDSLDRNRRLEGMTEQKNKYQRRESFFSKTTGILGIVTTLLFLVK